MNEWRDKNNEIVYDLEAKSQTIFDLHTDEQTFRLQTEKGPGGGEL